MVVRDKRWILRTLLGIALVGLSANATLAQPRMEVEAAAGVPFGVGRISFQAERGVRSDERGVAALAVDERSGRVLYPAYESTPVRQLIRDLIAAPPRVTVYFLFQGAQPLQVTLYTPRPFTASVTPVANPGLHQRLLKSWWKEYSGPRKLFNIPDEHPPEVENYLRWTLARRLGIEGPGQRPAASQIDTALSLLAGTELLKLAIQKDLLLAHVDRLEPAEIQLPEQLPAPPIETPADAPPAADLQIEPIAMRVPVECLYVRFSAFPNFLWLQHRLQDWAGDARNLIAERGVDYQLNAHFQQQLGLKQSALAEVLGERVIADVALVGTDTFMREGAAMGILFQARNNFALRNDLTTQRNEAMKRSPGAVEKVEKIGDREVSFVSSPDNKLRSFYVVDGDYHFVTTSRTLARRFLETHDKQGSVGASPEFRFARSIMPVERKDAIFVYLSEAFFRNLAGPQYRVEMTRRLRSLSEIESLSMARLEAQAEGKQAGTIDELIAADILPRGFGRRSDGSQLVLDGDVASDSLRGARGSFVPIPDVEIQGVTQAEADDFQKFADYFATTWGRIDPVLAGIQRQEASEGFERVIVDLQAAPLSAKHYKFLASYLGPPTDQRLVPAPGDRVTVQAMMRGGQNVLGGNVGPEHQLFGSLRDPEQAMKLSILGDAAGGLLATLQSLRGYVGAWPHAGWLSLLGASNNGPVDAGGFTQLRFGLWQRQINQLTLLSFHPEVLGLVGPQLRFEQAPSPAQFWLRADDLLNTRLGGLINNFGYKHARKISIGNTQFLHSLDEQLHVPPEKCMEVAETILDAKVTCPLAGKYELSTDAGGLKTWLSSAVRGAQPPQGSAPPGYQFPAMRWVRGLYGEGHLEQSVLSAHLEMNMPADTRKAPALQLPTLPSLPWSWGKSDAPAKPEAKAEAKPGVEAKAPTQPLIPPSEVLPPPKKPAGKPREF